MGVQLPPYAASMHRRCYGYPVQIERSLRERSGTDTIVAGNFLVIAHGSKDFVVLLAGVVEHCIYELKGDKRRAVERYQKYLASNPDDADKVRKILAGLQ